MTGEAQQHRPMSSKGMRGWQSAREVYMTDPMHTLILRYCREHPNSVLHLHKEQRLYTWDIVGPDRPSSQGKQHGKALNDVIDSILSQSWCCRTLCCWCCLLLLLLLRALMNDIRRGLLSARCETDIHLKCVVAVIFSGAAVLMRIIMLGLYLSNIKATCFIVQWVLDSLVHARQVVRSDLSTNIR